MPRTDGGTMAPDTSGITEEVAAFVEAIRFEDFSPEVKQVGKRCIIDGIGVILAGTAEPCTRILRDYILAMGGREELAEKFSDCVHRILKPDQASMLMETVESLESLDSLPKLIAMAAG
jgi:2-methylcitrate dehydratase PrpD